MNEESNTGKRRGRERRGKEPRGEIREYGAPGIVVTWEAGRCQHAAECVRGLPRVFDTEARTFHDARRFCTENSLASPNPLASRAITRSQQRGAVPQHARST